MERPLRRGRRWVGRRSASVRRKWSALSISPDTSGEQTSMRSEEAITEAVFRYFKTTLYGLSGCCPDYVMLMVGANAGLIGMSKVRSAVTWTGASLINTGTPRGGISAQRANSGLRDQSQSPSSDPCVPPLTFIDRHDPAQYPRADCQHAPQGPQEYRLPVRSPAGQHHRSMLTKSYPDECQSSWTPRSRPSTALGS